MSCNHTETNPTRSFRTYKQTQSFLESRLAFHPLLLASFPHLQVFCSSAVAPHIKKLRLVPKHLWWLDEALIMEFGYTIWVNIWLRTAETLSASEKSYEFFSINYYTPFLKLAFPCLFSLPIQILALFQGSAKSLLPQCACPDCPAHTVNPICI